MKMFLAVSLAGFLGFVAGHASLPSGPSITMPTPVAWVRIAASDGTCTRINQRYNPRTGQLEPVAENDPLGIR